MNTPHQRGQSKSHKRKQTGQALVEFSLILPMLLFLLLGVIDYGRILLVFSNASSSVRNAARQGTLVGEVTDFDMGANTPRYMACATITDFASDVFGATINSVDVLYFNTEDPTINRAQLTANLEALDPTVPSTLTTANFDCTVAANPPRISEGDIETGDLMVILLSTRVDFITPLLSSIFPSFELSFRAQRTLVEALVLNVEGDDLDGDGLLDEWELRRFGCVLQNTDDTNTPVFLMPDNTLSMRVGQTWSFLTNSAGYDTTTPDTPVPYAAGSRPGTPILSGSYTFPANCARDNLSLTLFDLTITNPTQYDYLDCATATSTPPDSDPTDDLLENCIVVALDLFSSTSDPDGDGCNNGCEEARFTCPITDVSGTQCIGSGDDSDGDGLSDTAEIGGGTDPNNVDTDGDGLWDGTERCEVEDPSAPFGCASSLTIVDNDPSDGIYPYLNGEWTNTNPNLADSDGDSLGDFEEYSGGVTDPSDGDTDDDGLNDGAEVNGFVLELEIDGLVFTLPSLVYTTANVGDSDGDGILDGTEVGGYPVTYNVNGVPTTFTVKTHPVDFDTDDDGICDGNANFNTVCTGVADVNPTLSDTDNDGLTDGEEQLIHFTLADNINSDADTCNLTDGFEMLGDQAVASNIAYGTYDLNAVDGVNAMDLESDGDGILDCVEVDTYGSNPYDPDSDGDTYTDDIEILPANWCLEILRDDSAVTFPCGGAGGGDDLDNGGAGDGYPDAWELLYYTSADDVDFSDPTNADLDGDGCNIQCEYERRTDPTDPDTDNDGISDGLETGSNPLIADTDGDGLIDGREGSATCIDLVSLQAVNPAYTAADCYATNPLLTDSDLDGLTDGQEVNGGLTVTINGAPVAVTSDPVDNDTDNDGLKDGEEVNGVTFSVTINGDSVTYAPVTVPSNPNLVDSDGDGVHDFLESKIYRTFANDSDTDNDTIQDGSTVGTTGEFPNSFDDSLAYYDTNPLETDSDNDGLTDVQEINGFNVVIRVYDSGGTPTDTNTTIAGYGSNIGDQFATTNLQPRNSDTDGDGLSDGDEINVGDVTNPTLANTDGDVNGSGNPIVDGVDNCPIHDNSDQQDLDMDGMGSVCDTDGETPTTVYVDPITDASNLVDATNWTPSVTVKAVNTFDQAQSGVDITVEFTDPNNGGALIGVAQTCTTVASGECTVSIGSQSQATFPDVVATVTALANPPAGLSYTPASNDGPLAFSVPPLSVRVVTITGSNSGTANSWQAFATVTVEDDFGASVDGVDVEVTFTDNDGLVATEVCSTTGGVGQCQVSTGAASLDATDPDATATISNITNLGGYAYSAANNTAPIIIAGPPYEAVTAGTTTRLDNGNSWTATLEVAVSNGTTLLDGRTVTFNYTTTTRGGTVSNNTATCANTTGSTGTGECTITVSGLTDNGNNNIVCTVAFSINNVTGVTDPYTSALNSGFPVTIINPSYGTNPTCP